MKFPTFTTTITIAVAATVTSLLSALVITAFGVSALTSQPDNVNTTVQVPREHAVNPRTQNGWSPRPAADPQQPTARTSIYSNANHLSYDFQPNNNVVKVQTRYDLNTLNFYEATFNDNGHPARPVASQSSTTPRYTLMTFSSVITAAASATALIALIVLKHRQPTSSRAPADQPA